MQCPKCSTQNEEGKKFCTNCGAALEGGSEPGADVMIGQTLGGKYKVIRLLGEGGMGAVYEGEQQLGTTKRKDGTVEVTYHKWPLYTWVIDSAPGDDTGQDLNNLGGKWYVITPAGRVLTKHP